MYQSRSNDLGSSEANSALNVISLPISRLLDSGAEQTGSSNDVDLDVSVCKMSVFLWIF